MRFFIFCISDVSLTSKISAKETFTFCVISVNVCGYKYEVLHADKGALVTKLIPVTFAPKYFLDEQNQRNGTSSYYFYKTPIGKTTGKKLRICLKYIFQIEIFLTIE